MVIIFSLAFLVQLLPSLYEVGRKCTSDGDLVNRILTDTATALTNEFTRSIQVRTNIILFLMCWREKRTVGNIYHKQQQVAADVGMCR